MTIENPPEVIRAGELAQQSYDIALEVKVDSAEMLDLAGGELRSIVTRRKQIEELRLSLTRPLDESKKRIMDLFRAPTDRLGQAESLLRDEITRYQREQAEIAERARREAEEQQRRDRLEQEHREREAEAKRQAAEREAEEARRAGDVEAAQAAEQVAQEAAAQAEEAREQVETIAIAPPPALPAVAAKAAGISNRKNWKADVTDLRALVIEAAKRAEAGDDFLLGFLCPDTKALGAAAKAMQAKLKVPGVHVYAEDVLSVRKLG